MRLRRYGRPTDDLARDIERQFPLARTEQQGNILWQQTIDPTALAISPGGGTIAPVKRGTPVTIMDITVEVVEALRPVFIIARIQGSAAGNSNTQHALWRNGAVFLATRGPADFRDWLIGTGTAAAQGMVNIGTFGEPAPQGGINGLRQPLLPMPLMDFPGVGTHVYSMAHGGTGLGGTVQNRLLQIGH